MKQHINEVKCQSNFAFENKAHVQWEFGNTKFGNFFIEFAKNKAKLRREKAWCLEVKLKELEQNLGHDEAKEQYYACSGEINKIYDEVSNGIKIRRKCDWYEFGEKSSKFFLTSKKRRATENVLHKLLSNELEVTDLSIK